jgi:hypothetical protein
VKQADNGTHHAATAATEMSESTYEKGAISAPAVTVAGPFGSPSKATVPTTVSQKNAQEMASQKAAQNYWYWSHQSGCEWSQGGTRSLCNLLSQRPSGFNICTVDVRYCYTSAPTPVPSDWVNIALKVLTGIAEGMSVADACVVVGSWGAAAGTFIEPGGLTVVGAVSGCIAGGRAADSIPPNLQGPDG